MSALSDLRQQISARMTPRIGYGLVALLATGLFLLVDELSTRSDDLSASVADLKTELTALQDESSAQLWLDRAAQAAAARAAWEELDWVAETPGIASAEIQAALSAMAAQSGITGERVQVTGDPSDMKGRRVLRFEVTSITDGRGFMQLLVAISTAQKRLIVDEITTTLNPGGQPGRVYIAGYAPYRGAAPPAAGGQPMPATAGIQPTPTSAGLQP